MAVKVSNTNWKLAFSDGVNVRQITIEARNMVNLKEGIEKAKWMVPEVAFLIRKWYPF
jgi:hypothetical protein